MKDALTLQLASRACCVPGVVLGASGASNKENRNVSLKTQLPPKPLTCGLHPEPGVFPNSARRGEGSCQPCH